MHSSRCIAPAAGMRTILLPLVRPPALVGAAGAAVNAGLQGSRRHAVVVSTPVTTIVTLAIDPDGASAAAAKRPACIVEPGTTRIYPPRAYTNVELRFVGAVVAPLFALAWIEEIDEISNDNGT